MSLQHATIAQLLEWQRAIVEEIAARTVTAAPPPPVRAPWEMSAPAAPAAPPAKFADNADDPWDVREANEKARLYAERDQARHEIDRLRAQVAAQTAPAAKPPAMLGGQQRLQPGSVIATAKTDPAAAEVWSRTPIRNDGVPPVQGNGRLEGMIDV